MTKTTTTPEEVKSLPLFTHEQKCQAFAAFYYLSAESRHETWLPTVGSYYTIRRGDLELFRILELDEGRAVVTSNVMDGTMTIEGFGQDSFHAERVPVPDHILGLSS